MCRMHRCLPDTVFGSDIDDVFAYPTTQFARIRDARLGIFKYLLTIGIICYVGIYQLWMNGGYLAESTVTGSTRFTLQQPTKDACSPDDAGCKNEFGSVFDLDYCDQAVNSTYVGTQLPCEFYENIGAQIIFDNSIAIVTRQKVMDQDLVCTAATATDGTCPFVFNSSSYASYYTVDAEKFTVLVDHSMISDSFPDLQGTSAKLDGMLYTEHSHTLCKEYAGFTDAKGGKRTDKAPCYITPNSTSTGLDYFSLDVLLRAAGTSLDEVNYGGNTYRYTGMLVQLRITYSNFRNWHGSGPIYYTYEPNLVKHSTYKAYDAIYGDYRQTRTLIDKHGVQLQAIQGGEVRQFDFLNLLIVLTTSLTLLAMANVITDFMALYVLADKEVYKSFMYHDTPDFSDLRDARERAQSGAVAPEDGDALENPLLPPAAADDGVDERKSGDPAGEEGLRMTAARDTPSKSWLPWRNEEGGDGDSGEA